VVKLKNIFQSLLLQMLLFAPAYAEDVAQKQPVEADACDDRQSDDDMQTALNRAIDKASLSAVKLSGIIQKQSDNKIYASVLDVISYHIIDNYFCFTAFKIFSLTLAFSNLTMCNCGVFVFILLRLMLLRFHEYLRSLRFYFSPNLASFRHYFFFFFFSVSFSIS
jgi:hypothetical protein